MSKLRLLLSKKCNIYFDIFGHIERFLQITHKEDVIINAEGGGPEALGAPPFDFFGLKFFVIHYKCYSVGGS